MPFSLNKRREPGGERGRNSYDAGEGALSRRERSGDAMGEGAPLDVARVLHREPDPERYTIPLASTSATPTHTAGHKTPLHTSSALEIQSKQPVVDKAGEESRIFRGLVVEEIVDSISSTGPPSLSRKLSTELQICDSELPPSKIGFYTEFTPVMKIIIFKLFCASLPSSTHRRGS